MGKKETVNETVKDYQRSKGEEPDSSNQFAAAEHQAKNDAQDAGEDVGSRDRSSKSDVPSKESEKSEPKAEKTESSEKK